MVIDLKKIHLKSAIEDDALWVVEQIPSLVEADDVTPILRTGSWKRCQNDLLIHSLKI